MQVSLTFVHMQDSSATCLADVHVSMRCGYTLRGYLRDIVAA
jgi:hypothetical protein